MPVILLILWGVFITLCVKINHMSFMKKLAAKIVLVYVMLGWMVLCVGLTVFSASQLYENQYGNTKEARLLQAQKEMSRGSMEYVMSNLYHDKSYEPEFEYIWERGIMYRAYSHYRLFIQASETKPGYAPEAERYRELLRQICADSIFPENELYAEFYMQELE